MEDHPDIGSLKPVITIGGKEIAAAGVKFSGAGARAARAARDSSCHDPNARNVNFMSNLLAPTMTETYFASLLTI